MEDIKKLEESTDVIYIFHKTVLQSINTNTRYSIREHVEWVLQNFHYVEDFIAATNKRRQVYECPIHGWVFGLRRIKPNRCPECHKISLIRIRKIRERRMMIISKNGTDD